MHLYNRILRNKRKSFLYSTITIVIASSINNIDLFSLAGSPSSLGNYIFIINNGVIVGSTSASTPSIITGAFGAGNALTLINNGNIYGKEGVGGYGVGQNGGAALSLSIDINIDNTNGNIYGGGAAGGSGGGSYEGPGETGQGFGNQIGLPPGLGAGQPYQVATPVYEYRCNGYDCGWYFTGNYTYSTAYGASGGAGGAWGQNGSNAGYAGGVGGNAILLNGKSVTFFGGNNSNQIKGAVA